MKLIITIVVVVFGVVVLFGVGGVVVVRGGIKMATCLPVFGLRKGTSVTQCDQMARLFNIWPFTEMKIDPIACFSQNRCKILPSTEYTLKNIAKYF